MFIESFFLIAITLSGTWLTLGAALFYLRNFRIERPPIGVFVTSDSLLLAGGLFALPLLYQKLPSTVLSVLVVLGILIVLFVGLRPVIRGRRLWLCLVLILAALWLTYWLAGRWEAGGILHWIVNDLLIVLVAISAANLYVQAGMRLRHVMWFLAAFAVYDGLFAWGIELTGILTNEFIGAVFQPSFGLILGPYRATLGLGDLLSFALFWLCMEKGFGRKGAMSALPIVSLFGTIMPSLLAVQFVREGIPFFPVQVCFAPVAIIGALLLLGSQKERSTAEWLRQQA